MENGVLTKHEFITYSLTAIGILLTFFFTLLSIMSRIIIEKAKVISLEDNKELSNKFEHDNKDLSLEINEVKTNYMARFDEIKAQISNLQLIIEKKFNELNVKIEVIKNKE